MIGKKNIVFGFLFFMLTAALGPLMIIKGDELAAVRQDKQRALERLGQVSKSQEGGPPAELLTVGETIDANARAILAIDSLLEAEAGRNLIKSGPHSHGNLEALLNIVVGVVLCFVAVAPLFKQMISWLFISGAVFHSGMLYLAVMLGQGWAWQLLKLGPPLLLFGLLAMAVAVLIGFRGQIIPDVESPSPQTGEDA